MNNDSIAIVIPCYRQEHYLFRALSSAVWQLRDGDEIIIVHESDTPIDPKFVRPESPQITVLENGGKKGASFSRNRAIQHAKADWIKFLDADDMLAPYALNIVRGCIDIPQHVQMITGGMHRIMDNCYCDYLCADEQTMQDFLIRNPTLPSLTFVRRAALLEVGGFDPRIDWEEDWDLWLKLRARYGMESFQIVNQPVCYYWSSEEEARQKGRKGMVDGMFVRDYFAQKYGATPE